jgi:hypothetical protein
MVKGFAAKPSITGWLLFGGIVIAVIATFFPFLAVSFKGFEGPPVPNGGPRIVVFVLAAVAAWLAWPTLSRSLMAVGRLIGLSAVVFLLVGLMVVWFNKFSKNSENGEIVKVSSGFGLLLYGAAVVVIAVGVVRLWIDRSRTQKQLY